MQFGAYGDPGRDPRGNVVSVAFLAVGPDVPDLVAGSDAADARLWRVADVVDGSLPLAFDHHRIVSDALDHAADRLQDSDLATAFVGPEFTLSELRSVYEAVWGEPLDAANFRRSLALDSTPPYADAVRRRRRARPRGRPAARALPGHRELEHRLARQAAPSAARRHEVAEALNLVRRTRGAHSSEDRVPVVPPVRREVPPAATLKSRHPVLGRIAGSPRSRCHQ